MSTAGTPHLGACHRDFLPRHRLTGWNAVKSRVEQLSLVLTDEQVGALSLIFCPQPHLILFLQIKDVTAKIKELADVRTQSLDDVDTILRVYHSGIQSGKLMVGQKEALDRLLRAHREASISIERSGNGEQPTPIAASA